MNRSPDLSDRVGEIARHLLGPPNDRLSSDHQLRFGTNGSIAVEIAGEKKGTWFDHESGVGGGPRELMQLKGGMTGGQATDWLKSELGICVEQSKAGTSSRLVAAYNYRDEHGELLFQVCRFDPKDFRQRRPDGSGSWIWKVQGVRQVPYRLPELIGAPADEPIFVVEGEKDVDNLAAVGVVATCNAGGAAKRRLGAAIEKPKWRPELNSFFRDRNVVIIPDNDDAGRDHATAVARNLVSVAAQVRILALPGMPPKGDVSDWLNGGGTRDALKALGANAQLVHQTSERPDIDAAAAHPAQKQQSETAGVDWYSQCIVGAQGQVLGNLANALLALRSDSDCQGMVKYDEMLGAPMLCRPVPRHGAVRSGPDVFEPRPVRDDDVVAIQEWLQIEGIPTVSKDTTHSAVDLIAQENKFHPVREYLDGLVWDGTDRLPEWLNCYLGVVPTAYATAVGTMFLISLVARILRPGCKSDYMLILQGSQGAKKSSACQILGGEWFSDNMPENLASKDASQHIRGKWLIELAELHALGRSEMTGLKAFLTRPVEIYRPSYGRKEVHEPRQVVFIGSTNKNAFLRDETGGRRFWPVTVGHIDLDLLAQDRDQLFAEAVVRYRRGETWWPTAEFEREHIAPEQEDRYEADAWEDLIGEFLERMRKEAAPLAPKVTVHQVARDALSLEPSKLGTLEQRRITAVLERAGWRRGKRTGKCRYWVFASDAVTDMTHSARTMKTDGSVEVARRHTTANGSTDMLVRGSLAVTASRQGALVPAYPGSPGEAEQWSAEL
jgi:predicted P-loop ATPase